MWTVVSADPSPLIPAQAGSQPSKILQKKTDLKSGIREVVIARQMKVGDFADLHLSEPIQLLSVEDWIASSHSFFEDEERCSSQ